MKDVAAEAVAYIRTNVTIRTLDSNIFSFFFLFRSYCNSCSFVLVNFADEGWLRSNCFWRIVVRIIRYLIVIVLSAFPSEERFVFVDVTHRKQGIVTVSFTTYCQILLILNHTTKRWPICSINRDVLQSFERGPQEPPFYIALFWNVPTTHKPRLLFFTTFWSWSAKAFVKSTFKLYELIRSCRRVSARCCVSQCDKNGWNFLSRAACIRVFHRNYVFAGYVYRLQFYTRICTLTSQAMVVRNFLRQVWSIK